MQIFIEIVQSMCVIALLVSLTIFVVTATIKLFREPD